MKRRILTGVVLVGALAAFIAGLVWTSAALIVLDAALEVVFWLTIDDEDPRAPAQPPPDK